MNKPWTWPTVFLVFGIGAIWLARGFDIIDLLSMAPFLALYAYCVMRDKTKPTKDDEGGRRD